MRFCQISAGVRGEGGFAMIALLVTILVATVVGVNMVEFMSHDITHAGIQGDVSRAFYVAEGGLRDAMQQLGADPTYAGGLGIIPVQPGQGSFFTVIVPWDAEARIFEVTSTGTYGPYSRAIRALVQFGGNAPAITGRNGVLIEGAGGAPVRTYLAPYNRISQGPNIGSFREIRIKDPGVRVNALTSFQMTLQDGTFYDYELFGYASLPSFDPNSPALPPALAGDFGHIVQFGLTAPDFADLTVRNDTTNRCPDYNFACDISVLRAPVPQGGANMTDVYMAGVQKQINSMSSVDVEQLRAEARANTLNASINADLGYDSDGEFSGLEFRCVLWYLARHPGVLQGPIFVNGDVTVGGVVNSSQCNDRGTGSNLSDPVATSLTINAASAGTPAFLAVNGGNLTLENNTTLSVGTSPANFNRQLSYGGVYAFSSTSLNGHIELGSSSTFRAVGLSYTQNGILIRPTTFFDLIGVSYNDAQEDTPYLESFHNWNATVVIRSDPRAGTRLEGGRAFLGILSWWQLP